MRLLESIHTFDLATFDWCLHRKHRHIAIRFARVLSFSANGPLYLVAAFGFVLLQNWTVVQLLAIAFAAERFFYLVFKSLFKRNRPPAAIPGYSSIIEPSDRFSFPSGHTSAAFLVAFAISTYFPIAGWLLYPWATGVGAARVVLGVHFPTDTFAGALMGLFICMSVNACLT